MPLNEYGQPVGEAVAWTTGAPLVPVTLTGRTCRVEPLAEEHLESLYAALCVDSPPRTWTYMPAGPFADRPAFASYVEHLHALPATVPFAIVPADGTPAGIASFLRIDEGNGTAEVGYISYGSALQRTTAATEAMYLMATHVLDGLGYRRYEWKCDALNDGSRRAALRLGFTFEGVFRNALVYKGRNRDTAWFSITDEEWPRLGAAYERWLDPANFDERGRQRHPLGVAGAGVAAP
jgi:RimJ/RimL family protein N-acetyltransferase